MLKYVIALALLATPGLISEAQAAVVYSASTDEPFAGGMLGFSYEAPDLVGTTAFIERSALTNVVGDIQRIRFEAGCPLGGGASSCDQLTIITGSTSVYRYFADGAFGRLGSSAAAFGAAATLRVSASASAVPETATWAMMIFGVGAVGASMRRRRSRITSTVAFAS